MSPNVSFSTIKLWRNTAWWIPTVLIVNAAFYGALLPENGVDAYPFLSNERVENLLHILGFMLFSGSAYVPLSLSHKLSARKTVAWTFALSFFLAVMTEFIQLYSLGRDPSSLDLGLDMLGASTAIFLTWSVHRLKLTAKSNANAVIKVEQ